MKGAARVFCEVVLGVASLVATGFALKAAWLLVLFGWNLL